MERDNKGQFVKGEPSWNTGTKGIMKPNSGSFKKGNSPLKHKVNCECFRCMKNSPTRSKMTQKIRDKIGDANRGKIRSEESKEKNRFANTGSKTWNYTGVTPLNKLLRSTSMWKIWREAVYLRDNFTCQNEKCEFCENKIGVILHPHHIKPLVLYPELVYNVENGITYCAEFHLKSGLHKGIQKKIREMVNN